MVGLIEDPEDVCLEDVREMAEMVEHNDIAFSIDRLKKFEAAESEADLDDTDEVDLPFYEEDRELAFVLGIMVGGVLQTTEKSNDGE